MKKNIIIAISLLLIAVSLGYIWQNDSKENGNSGISEKQGSLDFERPEEKPNISGIVKNIIGNEVTILKIERPEISKDDGGEDTDIEKDESKEEPRSGSGGSMGMGGGMNQLNTDEENDDRVEMLKNMSVGEEKIIIPVG